MGQNPFHPGILDPQLLHEEGDLLTQAIDLGLAPNMTILTEGRPRQEHW